MRYRSSVRLSLLPALGISATLAIPEAYGQVLEEVLVTARKREENLQEVAVAVSVVSAKTIEDAGLVRLQEISQLVPNMTNTENVSNKATNITLRGISSAGGLGNDPAIGVYVDEVYVARESGFNADLLDIQEGFSGGKLKKRISDPLIILQEIELCISKQSLLPPIRCQWG